MKQIILTVPKNGYILQTRRIEIPRELASAVLTPKAQERAASAIRHGDAVSIDRHVAVCPRCGRETPVYDKNGRRRYSSSEVEQWVLDQQSLLGEPLPDALIFHIPASAGDDLCCAHCGARISEATQAQQVSIRERRSKLSVSVRIGITDLLQIHWAGSIRISEPALTECLTFNLRNGHTYLSLHGEAAAYAIRDLTNEDVATFHNDPMIQLVECSFQVMLTLVAAMQHGRTGCFPFRFQEMRLEGLILLTRFLGYPRSFYNAIPLQNSDNQIMKSFSGLARRLHNADHLPALLAASKLPQGKSIRKRIFSRPALMFYLPQMEALWEMLQEINTFRRILDLDAHLLFGTLATMHKQPAMTQFLQDYCAVFGKNRLFRLLVENDWKCYAAQYLVMNPYCQKEERKRWRKADGLPNCGFIDLGTDTDPVISIPVPEISEEQCPMDALPDCEISGFVFHRLCNLREFQRAGGELHNCLVDWNVRENGTVYGVINNRRYVAAVEVKEGRIVQAYASGNSAIEYHEPLFTAFCAWKKRFCFD